VTLSFSAWNDLEKFKKCSYGDNLGAKSSMSYLVMLLEIGDWPIELFALPSVYSYIAKVKNILYHRLPNLTWSASCAAQKTILSFSSVLEIKKWFKRRDVEDVFDL
jgi:hypothetical protein